MSGPFRGTIGTASRHAFRVHGAGRKETNKEKRKSKRKVEVINKLYDEGNEIIFITYRKDKYIKDPYLLTKNYLDRHGIKYNKLIANSGDKGIVCYNNKIDLFIDDSVTHLEDVSLYGIKVLLFDSEYNRDNIKFDRVKNWYQIYNLIGGDNNGREGSK